MLPNRNRLDAVLRVGQREALVKRTTPTGAQASGKKWKPLTDATLIAAIKEASTKDWKHPTYGPIEDWDVSQVTSMRNAFSCGSKSSRLSSRIPFDPDLSKWDVSNVTDMVSMFACRTFFTGKGLANWDVSKVTNMSRMFHLCDVFDADLSAWDVSNVTRMWGMFKGCHNFTGKGLENWNVCNVTRKSGMFKNSKVDPLPAWYNESGRPTCLKPKTPPPPPAPAPAATVAPEKAAKPKTPPPPPTPALVATVAPEKAAKPKTPPPPPAPAPAATVATTAPERVAKPKTPPPPPAPAPAATVATTAPERVAKPKAAAKETDKEQSKKVENIDRGSKLRENARNAAKTVQMLQELSANDAQIDELKQQLRTAREKEANAPVVDIYQYDEAAEEIDKRDKKISELEQKLQKLQGDTPAQAERPHQVVYKQNRAPAAYSAAAQMVDEVTKTLVRLEAQRSMKIDELEKLVLIDETIKETLDRMNWKSWSPFGDTPEKKYEKARAKAIEEMKMAIKQLDKDIEVAKTQLGELKAGGGGGDKNSALFAAIEARKAKQDARAAAIDAGEIEVESPRKDPRMDGGRRRSRVTRVLSPYL